MLNGGRTCGRRKSVYYPAMRRAPNAPTVSRALVGVLLVGLALVVGADLWNLVECSGEGGRACGALSGETRGQNDEQECDHCVGCIVAHGHVQSVVPTAALFPPATAYVCSTQPLRVRRFEPPASEIFHPPLSAAC
jgi:hypothetical protein